MTTITTVICDLHELASKTTDQETKKQLFNLWTNLCHIKRNEEALSVGGFTHTKETLTEAQNSLNKLVSSKTLKDNIIGA